MTSRQRIPPLQPNTPAQVSARDTFSSTLHIVRTIGPGVYQQDWNRGISKLPGYQSMFSTFMNASTATATTIDVDVPQPRTPLGILHAPDLVDVNNSVADVWNVIWSEENGENGNPDDQIVILAVARSISRTALNTRAILVDLSRNRNESPWEIDFGGDPGGTTGIMIALYVRPGPSSSVLSPSPAVWRAAT